MSKGSRKKTAWNKGVILAVTLVVCFAAALGIYFVRSIRSTRYEHAVYANMEEPSLPVLYAVYNGMEVNPMRGHYQNMGSDAADTVSILPKDRKLEVHIRKYGNTIVGLSYEVRNLARDHFIEKTEVTEFTEAGDVLTAVLPIQNLIEKENTYLLCVTLDTGGSKVNYYTKILWTDNEDAYGMLELAKEFNRKAFDYEEARDLTQYMETDPKAANDNLGTVTIGSSFSLLTWGETGMQPASDPEVYLRDYQGMTGDVEIVYRTKTDNATDGEEYLNTDYFNMRTGAERIYVMNYRRKTYEVFNGSKHRFSGKMIMLGITDPQAVSVKTSESGQFIAYKTDKELWCYDQKNQRAVNIFSFRSETDDGVRSLCREHDVKILAVDDHGTVDFAVYGYMNRGRHEGYNGLVYYRYEPDSGIITENLFVPFASSYEKISAELDGLCAKGSGDLFYFKQNGSVYAVDLKSLEMMEVVSGLTEDTYGSSESQHIFAFLENGKYGSDRITLLNISTGQTQQITADEGDVLQILAFNDEDIVVGVSAKRDLWLVNGRLRSLPFYRMEIYDENLEKLMTYEKKGKYLDDFVKTDNRFLFNLYKRAGVSSFRKDSSDTVVSAQTEPGGTGSGCEATTSGEKQKVYYISISEELRNTKKLTILVPESISYENSGNVEIRSETPKEAYMFYAYEYGHLAGMSTKFSEALEMCYDGYGTVKDANGGIIYMRSDRGTFHTIRDPIRQAQPVTDILQNFTENKVTEENYLIIDARDADINQIINFIYKDHPVVWQKEDGSYKLLFAYDAKQVKALDPETGEEEILSREQNPDGSYICFTSTSK